MANERNDSQSMDMEQSQKKGSDNRGKFQKNDPRASEAGRKGGQASRGGGRRMAE